MQVQVLKRDKKMLIEELDKDKEKEKNLISAWEGITIKFQCLYEINK